LIVIERPNGLSAHRLSRGFTLIEIAVVIVVLSLLLAMIAGIATAMVGQQRREATRQRLAGVETAFALYVSQNKRLPCPADGRLPSSDSNAGLERPIGGVACQVVTGTANSQTHGVVPWRTLGLAESDVTDGWGNRLSYRVAPELVLSSAMDLTACDPAGAVNPPTATAVGLTGTPAGFCNQTGPLATDCNASSFPDRCTPPSTYTASKGLKIRTLDTSTITVIMSPTSSPSTGAAYVVISHGENGIGAYSNQGTIQSGSVASGTLEAANNAANITFTYAASTSMLDAAAFVDDFPSYSPGGTHFDDFVVRPSILALATKAQLGPRAH
jgi:prepilin-type N-terminal cleavage/methylation domain-containing protein